VEVVGGEPSAVIGDPGPVTSGGRNPASTILILLAAVSVPGLVLISLIATVGVRR
jgi:hypothetical protein